MKFRYRRMVTAGTSKQIPFSLSLDLSEYLILLWCVQCYNLRDFVAADEISPEMSFEAIYYAAKEQNVLQQVVIGKDTWSFLIILIISIPLSVRDADSKLLQPTIFPIHHFMNLWSCSTLLFTHLHWLILIFFKHLLL